VFKKTSIFLQHRLNQQKTRFKKRIFLVLAFLLLGGLGSILAIFLYFSMSLPSINKLSEMMLAQSSVIYDRNGEELYILHGDENRTVVPLAQIPDAVVRGTLAIEDQSFFEHHGFAWKGITKAVISELTNFGGHRMGGSTLTQQLVKNLLLSSEKTYTRKVKELILALRIELKLDKEEILGLYLNSIPYGANAYGVGQASLTFFDKNVSEIALPEAAILAALPKAPSFYSPYGPNVHSKVKFTAEELAEMEFATYDNFLAKYGEDKIVLGLLPTKLNLKNNSITVPGRTSAVLNRMQELGFIDEMQKKEAEEILLAYVFADHRSDIKAPHFVMYVRDILEKQYGKEVLQAGGLKIYTTLDYKIQAEAEKILQEQCVKNEKQYGAKNAALVTVNSKTGEILSMIGSRDYWEEENDGNVNVILSRRLPGSSFKPFAYAAAFAAGYAPGTVTFDLEMDFGNGYKPKNFDGSFRGPVSFRRALGNSLNIPAIQAGILGGLQRTYDLAEVSVPTKSDIEKAQNIFQKYFSSVIIR